MKDNLKTLCLIGVSLFMTSCEETDQAEMAAAMPFVLAGTEWGHIEEKSSQFDKFIQFQADNKVSGFSGCNRFFGTYVLEGETLSIGPLASTKKMCKGAMAAEGDFLSALQATKRVSRKRGTMTLRDAKGKTLLHLAHRDWD